jgi:Flp pilus assembly protein TadB
MALSERTDRTESLEAEWRRAQAEIRALGAQVAGITDELRELMRRESALARAEIQDNVGLAGRGAAFGGGAAVLSLYTIGFLGLAITFGLATVMPLWAAALLTAAAFGACAVLFGSMAKSRFDQFRLKPSRTLRSLREDMQWARAQIKRNAQ